MEKKICALELASYLVRLDYVVYVSCSTYVEVEIRLYSLDVPKLQQVLNSILDVYHFTYEFLDRSDLLPESYVCRCSFKLYNK